MALWIRQRLITACIAGTLGAVAGIVIAIRQDVRDQMFGVALATGLVGFMLGLVFKLRLK